MAPGVAAARPLRIDESTTGWVAAWLWSVAALVIAMVAVGGATRLTDSGLSITEWKPLLGAIPPLSDADWADAFAKYKLIPEYKLVNEGMSLAAFKTIYWWEWAHRFLGRFIGVVYGLPLLVFWVMGMIPRAMKLPLFSVLLLGALQGFVGWYMVQSGLTERIDVSHYRLAMHLTLAFIILGALVWLALAATLGDPLLRTQRSGSAVRPLSVLIALLVLVQVVLGAFVAGTKAGLTYNTWPLMDGDLIPTGMWNLSPWYMNVVENLTTIQFNHRVMAYVLLVVVGLHLALVCASSENSAVKRSAWCLAGVILLQIVIGIWTLLSADGSIPLHLGVVHQTMAAFVFAIAIWHMRATLFGARS